MIRSKYERHHGWLDEWYSYDAATRADFYVRLFGGLIQTTGRVPSDVGGVLAGGGSPLPGHHCAGQRSDIDWETLLSELNEVNFHGALILELAGRSDVTFETVLADARQARLYLRHIARRLSLSTPPTVGGAAPGTREPQVGP